MRMKRRNLCCTCKLLTGLLTKASAHLISRCFHQRPALAMTVFSSLYWTQNKIIQSQFVTLASCLVSEEITLHSKPKALLEAINAEDRTIGILPFSQMRNVQILGLTAPCCFLPPISHRLIKSRDTPGLHQFIYITRMYNSAHRLKNLSSISLPPQRKEWSNAQVLLISRNRCCGLRRSLSWPVSVRGEDQCRGNH